MKKLFTLVLAMGVLFAFAQTSQTHNHPVGHPQAVNNHVVAKRLLVYPHNSSSVTRSESACDSFDLMDYCTYNEVWALDEGQASSAYYGFNTQGNPLYVQEITSQLTDYSANELFAYSYAGMCFDTLAFEDYPSQTLYNYAMKPSTITLEGVEFFYAYDADTLAGDGKIANDSLIFTVYPINNGVVDTTTTVATYIEGGDSLSGLYTGPTSVGIASVPFSAQLNQGQGFYIKVNYLNKDTSTHFELAFTFLDSCGLVSFEGGQYTLADASPLYNGTKYDGQPGLSFFGVITGRDSIENWNNFYGIQSGVPTVCSLVPNQNWALLPIIDVCQDFSAQVQASAKSACPGASVNLSGTVVGSPSTITVVTPNTLTISGAAITDSLHYGNASNSNLTYTWSVSAGTLDDSNSPTPTLTMPATGNVTVTMQVSDGTADTTASLVIASSPINLSVTNSQPIALTCAGSVTITTSVTGSTTGHDYTWKGVNLDTTGTGVSKLKVSYPGTYYISVVNAAGCTSADTVTVSYPGVSNTVSFTESAIICQNQAVQFMNTSSNQTGWTAEWYFGDVSNDSSSMLSPSFAYPDPGSFSVELIMDSAGCVFDAPVKNIIVYSSSSQTCLGIQDITFDNSINIMPNPTNGYVNMVINGIQSSLAIKVYNILGSEVYTYSASELPASINKTFDFNNLASGTYLVKIQSGDQIAVKKLVISK